MEGLGINLRYLIFQIGNFVVLFVGLTYLLHKPLLKLLESRKKEISDGLKLAEKMRKEAVESEVRQKVLLENAQTEAAGMLKEARQQAKELEEKLEEQAQVKAEQIMKRASQEIEEQKVRMKQELREDIAHLIVQATEKVLESPLTHSDKEEQVSNIIKGM